MFYVVRFLLGVAEAGFFPGIIFCLTLWYPSRLRSARTAIMDVLDGVEGLAGWQWLFLCEGVPSVGIWVMFYPDSSIEDVRWLARDQKDLLTRNLAAEDRHKTQRRHADAFRSGTVWVLSAIYFTLMIGLYSISFWLPTIVDGFGGKGYLEAGLITAIPYGVAVVGMVFLSRSSDRRGERRLHYESNVIAGAIGSMPLFWLIPSAFPAGTASAAGIGLVNSIGNPGGYVRPNLPIWTGKASADPSAPLYVIAAVLVLGVLLMVFLMPARAGARIAEASAGELLATEPCAERASPP
jgi:MFS family permease